MDEGVDEEVDEGVADEWWVRSLKFVYATLSL